MEFLAYSDIHHDDYNNGITLDDTIGVEEAITKYAVENQIGLVLFGGDWYRATNPTQKVIKAAEASWVRRCKAGVTTIAMPGNHDRWTKSITSGHAFDGVPIFSKDLSNVIVFDEIGMFSNPEVDFLFLPSGWENHPLSFTKKKALVVLFHGLISGSLLASGVQANSINPEFIKPLNPDLILGADNHTPQSLDHLFGCQSYYMGAPLQHGWGDRDQERGFWHVWYKDGGFNYQRVSTMTPRFVRKQVQANTEIEATCSAIMILKEALDNAPGVIDLTLMGRNAINLNMETIRENIRNSLGYTERQLKLSVDKIFESLEIVEGISEAKTPEDKWNIFVSKGNAPGVQEMNPKLLSEIGTWAIQEARKLT